MWTLRLSIYLSSFVFLIHILFVNEWNEWGFLPVLQRYLSWNLSFRLFGVWNIQLKHLDNLEFGNYFFYSSLSCFYQISLITFYHHPPDTITTRTSSYCYWLSRDGHGAESRRNLLEGTWKWTVCRWPWGNDTKAGLSLDATFSLST